MRVALIVHSDYARVSGFPAMPSAATNADWLSRRLSQSDTGFEVHRVAPDSRIVRHLAAVAKTRGGPGSSVLVAFVGYLALTEIGEPALLLDEQNVASLPISRLKKFLAQFSSAQVVLDVVLGTAVPGVDMANAPRVVSDRLVLDFAQANVAALVAVRPWGTPDSSAATPFTSLAMNTLEALGRDATTPITTGALYASMCQSPAAVAHVPGIGCATANPEFVLLQTGASVVDRQTAPTARPRSLSMTVFPAAAPPAPRVAPVFEPLAPRPAVHSAYRAGISAQLQTVAGVGPELVDSAVRTRLPELEPVPSMYRGRADTMIEADVEYLDAAPDPDVTEEPPFRPPTPTAADLRAEAESSVILRLGDEHSARGDYFAAQHEYQRGLELARTGAQRARMLSKLAAVQRALGNDEQALEYLSEAVAIEPGAADGLEALADLLRERSAEEADAFYVSLRARMATREAKRAVLEAAFRFWSSLRDDERALGIVEKLLADGVREPQYLAALETLSARHGGANTRFVSLERAARSATDPASRAELLLLAAGVAKNELHDPERAAALARAVLEQDPVSIGALEHISSALVAREDWDGLAATYERFLEGPVAPPAGAKIAVGLAKICLGKLRDKARAAFAYETALRFQPEDVRLRHDTAGLYESLGDAAQAGVHYRAAVRAEPRNPKTLERSYAYFNWIQDVDAAWNAALGLDYLGQANEEQGALAQAYASDGLLSPRRSLSEEDWRFALAGPRDLDVGQLIRVISDAGLALRMPKARRERQLLEQYTEMDPSANTTTLARTLLWTSKFFGQAAPKILLTDEERGVEPAAVSVPSALASKSLGRGLSLPQLSFVWGRALAMFRPEHYLFVFYPGGTMADLVRSALIGAELFSTTGVDSATKKQARNMRRELGAPALAELQSLTQRTSSQELLRRVDALAGEVERTCLRAGLIACGNLRLALDLCARLPLDGVLAPDEQLDELIRFSVSEEYVELRRRLGIAVG